jgi:hypothetical protein
MWYVPPVDDYGFEKVSSVRKACANVIEQLGCEQLQRKKNV